MNNSLKVSLLFAFTMIMASSTLAKSMDIFQLRDILDESSDSLFCNSASGKFSVTVDNGKNIILNAVVYGTFGGSSLVKNQLCETTLDEVLCSYGFEKWVAVDLRRMSVEKADGDIVGAKGKRLVFNGSVKSSAFSTDLEKISCELPIK